MLTGIQQHFADEYDREHSSAAELEQFLTPKTIEIKHFSLNGCKLVNAAGRGAKRVFIYRHLSGSYEIHILRSDYDAVRKISDNKKI